MKDLTNMGSSSDHASAAVVRTRSILRSVFLWMTLGLLITAVIALFVASQESLMRAMGTNPMAFIVLFIAQIALVFTLSRKIMTLKISSALTLFFLYSALNGVTLSFIFITYTAESIAGTFFITAATFAVMATYGYTTKADLSKFGHYLFMALIGLIIASIVNIFLRSSAVYWLISCVGVLIFTGLTAYDTQKIKRWGEDPNIAANADTVARVSILGALRLYLDFINLFLFLLRFLGNRR